MLGLGCDLKHELAKVEQLFSGIKRAQQHLAEAANTMILIDSMGGGLAHCILPLLTDLHHKPAMLLPQ